MSNNQSGTNIRAKGIVLKSIGGTLLLFDLYVILRMYSGDLVINSSNIVGYFLFLMILNISALFLIKMGCSLKKRAKMLNTQESIINMQQNMFIDDIETLTAQSIEMMKNVQKMTTSNSFTYTYVDGNTKRVVTQDSNMENPVQFTQQAQPMQQNMQPEVVSVKCSGCGAANMMQKGSVCSCEYCGSSLNP